MILLGGIMIITQEDIKRVLALYDDEDIPYVLSDFVVKVMASKGISTGKENPPKVKMKTRGDKNDGTRK